MHPQNLLNRKVKIPSQFSEPVKIENVLSLGSHYKLIVRRTDGLLEEIVVADKEIEEIQIIQEKIYKPVNANSLALLVESHRIRYAYSYDPYFAVSLSGIQTLPHQIEALYSKMLPQPRLRFLLANDPGAGKTINPNYELLKLTAQALAGTTLAGSRELISTTSDEKSLCDRLLSNWKLFKKE